MNALPRLVVILGPTASGKSSLGISLAERLDGEILVCDSTQVYRHFNIGTGKVSPQDQRGITHHLLDIADPQDVFTAGDYRRRALIALEDIRKRGKISILTAGTGLYLRALLEGLADAPTRSEELRERLRQKAGSGGPERLHQILARLDPEAAAHIAPRDTQKIIRAIEMRVIARMPVSEIHRSGRTGLQGYEVVKLGLLPPRPALYARIDARVEAMIRAGWTQEVRQLVANGVPPEAKAFQFIGYSELRAHVESRLEREEAVRQIQLATRRFAKRQQTWFRKETGVHWLAGFGDAPEIVSAALELLRTKVT